jgi:hypothetical protein
MKCYDEGLDVYLFTFMFNQIPGSREARVNQMQSDIYRWYGRLLTRMYRNPRSAKVKDSLPQGVFMPDNPFFKHEKRALRDVTVNDGIHWHGMLMARGWGRLGCPLHLHTERKQEQYLTGNLRRVHALQITDAHDYATDYALKALKRPNWSPDHLLILPRKASELPSRKARSG